MDESKLTDRQKRLINDGISIGMVTQAEVTKLVESHSELFKAKNIPKEHAVIIGGVDCTNMLVAAVTDTILPIELIPEILRITANALDIMVQNQKRNENNG